jgi:hypothetical protein
MEPMTQIQPPVKDHHNKPLFFAALIISLGIICFALWYGYNKQVQDLRNEETLKLLVNTPTDPVSDWKTYRNEEYGFEIKYPPEWKIDTLRSDRVRSGSDLVFDIGLYGHNYEGIKVDMSSSTVDEWVSEIDREVIIKISDFVVGGQPAKMVDTSEFAGKLIITKFDGRLYVFSTTGHMIDNGVLSTFKFIGTSTSN